MCACVCVCVRACVRVCVCVCVGGLLLCSAVLNSASGLNSAVTTGVIRDWFSVNHVAGHTLLSAAKHNRS